MTTYSFIVRTTIVALGLISLLWNIGRWRDVISPSWYRQERTSWEEWRDGYVAFSFIWPIPIVTAILTAHSV